MEERASRFTGHDKLAAFELVECLKEDGDKCSDVDSGLFRCTDTLK